MTPLQLPPARPFRLLCLGAHCDDIEIGCGATVLRLLAELGAVQVRWVVFTGSAVRQAEAKASADAFLAGAERAEVHLHGFRESFLPQQWGAVKEEFEHIKAGFAPSLILVHSRDDDHQDHRLLAELAWNTFRDHLIWEYEIPKYEGDFPAPNLFVPVSEDDAGRKVELITRLFASQRGRTWFDAETFRGLMRLRGVGCNAPWAEAFTCRKAVI
ncbi:MAG: PIG-L family deacetylase [Magnetospirillum sp.]|nr:PIG-L family deacetylase [Magnetospirillum sp.]